MRNSRKVFFENSNGTRLCGIIDAPHGKIQACALFSHCFTCTKDLKAIVKISRKLAEQGIAVLRFDFTGLGESKGSFSDSNFDSCCQDVLAAAGCISREHEAPSLLIGHSLGGAAMMSAVSELKSVRALVTIASPSSTEHLAEFLGRTNPEIVEQGQGPVEIGGRTYLLKKQLLDNLRKQDLAAVLQGLTVPHLIFHPREDQTLPYWHAERMYELTGGPKSIVTLDKSDHLLVTRPDDCDFVADLIYRWSQRYV